MSDKDKKPSLPEEPADNQDRYYISYGKPCVPNPCSKPHCPSSHYKPPYCPPSTCPPICTCPPSSCNCPPSCCTCPPSSCTCPPGSCTCPPGSCTCPEGSCPRSGELVKNPSFELSCPASGEGTPCNVFAYWQGSNIAASNEALTGSTAALLGSREPDNASLTQTFCNITPGCYYDFSFSANAQGLANNPDASFTANVNWLPSNQSAIDNTVNPIILDSRFSGNNYVYIKRITNQAPAGTNCVQITFTKTGTGTVLVDDVSFASL